MARLLGTSQLSNQTKSQKSLYKAVLAIAFPIMLSNISTPLIGVVDTAIVGQLPNPAHIGAVAISAMFFSFLFWGFGFLRMGTTSLTSQALGAENKDEIRANLARALLIGLGLGGVLVVFSKLISFIGFGLIEASPFVESLAKTYFEIRIWSAPATFINYALVGWFIGIGQARKALFIQITLNLLNAGLDWYFVVKVGLGVEGVAIGTLLAEIIAATIGLFVARSTFENFSSSRSTSTIWDISRLKQLFSVSKDIVIRSLALMLVFIWFTSQGALSGDVILAANAILMHFVTTTAYLLDGFAIASESLIGRAMGRSDRKGFLKVAKISTAWGFGVAILSTLIIFSTGPYLIHLLTIDPSVRFQANKFLPWAATAPIIAVWCYQLDGIFLGAAWTADMVKSMIFSTFLFFITWWTLTPLENLGLWISLYVHFCARAGSLAYFFPKLLNRDLPLTKILVKN